MYHQVDSSLGFTKEFEKKWIRVNLIQTLSFYETNLLKKTHTARLFDKAPDHFSKCWSLKKLFTAKTNHLPDGRGRGQTGLYKNSLNKFFPRKTSLLVHTFMCISRSWLFFRVYKRANALLIKILIQKLSFHKSNHFLTHNLDFWIKLLTIFQTVDLFKKIITAKTPQNFLVQ